MRVCVRACVRACVWCGVVWCGVVCVCVHACVYMYACVFVVFIKRGRDTRCHVIILTRRPGRVEAVTSAGHSARTT